MSSNLFGFPEVVIILLVQFVIEYVPVRVSIYPESFIQEREKKRRWVDPRAAHWREKTRQIIFVALSSDRPGAGCPQRVAQLLLCDIVGQIT